MILKGTERPHIGNMVMVSHGKFSGERHSTAPYEMKKVMKMNFEPAFETANIPVVFSLDNNYVPQLSVVLHSLLAHCKKNENYDIIVLEKDITEDNKAQLMHEFADWHNLSIRFIDMTPYVSNLNLYTGNRLTVETYFRLFLPYLLEDYDKVIYLDCDIAILHDLAEMYHVDMGDNLIAATRDCGIVGFCHNPNFDRLEYTNAVLKLKNIDDYLQAGVIMLNLDQFRQTYSQDEIIRLITTNNFRHHDQDALNILCEGRIHWLSQQWDFVIENSKLKMVESIQMAPKYISEAYFLARKDPYIVHYASELKPWLYPQCEFGKQYVNYMKKSAYYQLMLLKKRANEAQRRQLLVAVRRFIRDSVDCVIFPIGSKRRKILKRLYLMLRW